MNALLYLIFGLLPLAPIATPFPPEAAGFGQQAFLETVTLPKVFLLILMSILVTQIILLGDQSYLRIKWRDPVVVFSFLFLLVSFASLLNARHLDLFGFQFVRRVNLVLMVVILVLAAKDIQVLTRMTLAFFAGTGLLGALGLYEVFTLEPIRSVLGFPVKPAPFTLTGPGFRVSGAAGDPNFHAITFALPGVVAGMLVVTQRRVVVRALGIAALVVFFINVLGTASRGGLGAFLISLGLFWLLMELRWKYLLGVFAASAVVGGILAYTFMFGELTTGRLTGEVGDPGIEWRIGWWSMAVEMAKDRPVLGVGTGNFVGVYNRYVVAGVPREPHFVHNSFLQVLAENGAVGFLVYLALWMASARHSLRAREDPACRLLANMYLATLGGYAFFAATSNVLEHEFYWSLFALTAVLVREAERNGSVRAS